MKSAGKITSPQVHPANAMRQKFPAGLSQTRPSFSGEVNQTQRSKTRQATYIGQQVVGSCCTASPIQSPKIRRHNADRKWPTAACLHRWRLLKAAMGVCKRPQQRLACRQADCPCMTHSPVNSLLQLLQLRSLVGGLTNFRLSKEGSS